MIRPEWPSRRRRRENCYGGPPSDVVKILTDSIVQLSRQSSGGILTFAFVVAIWSSSGAMIAITTTLDAAYDVTESRPWWKTRLIAVALMVGIAVFIVTSIAANRRPDPRGGGGPVTRTGLSPPNGGKSRKPLELRPI